MSNVYVISVALAFNRSSCSKVLSDSRLRLAVSICPPTLNNLSTAAEDGSVVLVLYLFTYLLT